MLHNAGGQGKNFYESLDSGEQARDLPVYVGNEYFSSVHEAGSSYLQSNAINRTNTRDQIRTNLIENST
jgi:hypothetical protein